jgi:predicted component of type VI protein secretion system
MDQPSLIVDLTRGYKAPKEQFVFQRSPVHIGRGPRNELLIDHVFVSHSHGVLHFDASGVDFVDLGSTNGSFLEGARLESHCFTSVHAGALLNIGTTSLRVKLDYPRKEPPPPKRTRPQAPPSISASLEGSAHAASLAAVIERFAQSFLELSRGQRQWREQLGISTTSRSGLHALEDPMALLSYLLAPGHEASRLEELGVACEELMRNELALVHAIGAGGRDLLDELSPEALAPNGISGVLDWLSRLSGNDARWAAFEKHHDELQEESVRARIMIGSSFRRAYAESMQLPPPKEEEP